MGSRNSPVRVDALCCAFNNSLQVLGEINRLEVGVKLLGSYVAKVLGILGGVVSSDTPR